MGVFKTYDIRGVYGSQIDTALAFKVGRAFARFLGAERYMIGYDARSHSEELYQALGHGLVAEGKKVIGIGMVSTPQLHFFQMQEGCGGAVMVTASHNPPEYHGFKLYDGQGGAVSYAKGLDKIEAIVTSLRDGPHRAGGSFTEEDHLEAYVDFAAGAAGAVEAGALYAGKIVVDVGNGSAGRVFRRLTEKLSLDCLILNEQPDGTFLSRDPNPLKPESRRHAAAKVLELGAGLAALLDGDGDRVVFLDEHGESIENSFVAALIAEQLLAASPGSAIVYDLISSRALPERVRELGGRPLVSRVGYTFLYDAMVASGALFGAETSGHVYFKVTDRFYTESAAYALVLLLRLLAERGRPLSELVAPLRGRYAQSGEVNVEIADKEGALREIESRYAAAGASIDKLDGVSVELPEFWFNLRPSNTEPLLRLRLEAVSREVAQQKTRELRELLNRFA